MAAVNSVSTAMPADKLRDFLLRPDANGGRGNNNYATGRFDGAGGGALTMKQM